MRIGVYRKLSNLEFFCKSFVSIKHLRKNFMPICPRVFLSDQTPAQRSPPPSCPHPPLVNPDRKMHYAFDMKFGRVILCNVTKKMVEKKIKIAAIGMMKSLIMSFVLKNYAKNG